MNRFTRKPLVIEALERGAGRLCWIGLRPAHRAPMCIVTEVSVEAARGLNGDRASGKPGGRRQVTLIQWEHLAVIATLCGRRSIEPELLRRNLVISGINLSALMRNRFLIGSVLLEGSGPCAPCARMEQALGDGGYHAMLGHGGITAIVLEGGRLAIGNRVKVVSTPLPPQADLPLV